MTRIISTAQALEHALRDYRGITWEIIGELNRRFARRGRLADDRALRCEVEAAFERITSW